MKLSYWIKFVLLTILITKQAKAQQIIPLYKNIPNSKASAITEQSDSSSKRGKVSHVTNPTLSVFLPDKKTANGTAIIICPGGGYSYLVINDEGNNVARELNKKGIAAFVLKYRLPDDRIMIDKSIGPLQDAQRAIQLVREHAQKWNIDTSKVGVMGFSAGGHLASTLSTHYGHSYIDNPHHINLRPDFSILVYPVISFQSGILHKGSRKALIGEKADSSQENLFSNELQVTPDTPPAFLVACTDDKVVPVENSIRYYLALHHYGINAEMHLYEHGGHGFGLHNTATRDQWLERCFNWMQGNGLL
ncbi:MAG TPA: alpha/beta hydrolase [Chitinophagaceae bacterium]|nr:alpha/beta hydrolase [Chitinophagaceae bacterium]